MTETLREALDAHVQRLMDLGRYLLDHDVMSADNAEIGVLIAEVVNDYPDLRRRSAALAEPIVLVEDQERPLIWIAPRAEGLTERLATAMNLAYTYVGRDGEPTLPFCDDIDNFWEPFAARVVEALEP